MISVILKLIGHEHGINGDTGVMCLWSSKNIKQEMENSLVTWLSCFYVAEKLLIND